MDLPDFCLTGQARGKVNSNTDVKMFKKEHPLDAAFVCVGSLLLLPPNFWITKPQSGDIISAQGKLSALDCLPYSKPIPLFVFSCRVSLPVDVLAQL